ncbi:MAG TPA: lipocalin family protein [Pyrinomonadaceae bacterium]|nr:lipocalin family protein [Pyrinomonadaceae bacterium]
MSTKRLLNVFAALVLLCIGSFAQTQETFDIASFKSPAGWQKEAGQNALQIATEDKSDGTYCLIFLYKAIPALAGPDENFKASWDTIVKEAVKVNDTAQMIPAENKEEWKALGGYSPFEKEGEKGVAVLMNISGYGKMVNVLILTNTQKYEPAMTKFLESISLKKPESSAPVQATTAPAASPIVGTWGSNSGATMTYGDPVAAGMAGYSKNQYTFNTDGTYKFVSKTFRMSYDKILLVIENGTYQINGGALTIKPQKSVIQAWSKLNGVDKWGRMLSTQPRKLETVTYKFTKHYFSGIDEWNLVLQGEQPTERDGPFSTFTLFPSAWYYKPITANNPVVQLPQ